MSGIRRADVADSPQVARLLYDFNSEFDEPAPSVDALTASLRRLIVEDEVTVLLAGEPAHGFALLRLRPSYYAEGSEAYLQELYVVPQRRGEGIGRALLEAAMEVARARGAAHMELGTAESDTAAIALYETAGFTNRERGPDGPKMLYYERDL